MFFTIIYYSSIYKGFYFLKIANEFKDERLYDVNGEK